MTNSKIVTVKSSFIPDSCNYFTVDKQYKAKQIKNRKYLYEVECDEGVPCYILVGMPCIHLNGRLWEIVI